MDAKRLIESCLQHGADCCAIALIALGAVWLQMPAFPEDNNAFHIPLVLGYAFSNEGPHDKFHESLSHFVSFFWLAVSRSVNEDNIRTVFLTLHGVLATLTLAGAYAMLAAAGIPRKTAVIGAGMLGLAFAARETMSLGEGELFAGSLTHSQLAAALCLFALALAVRQRWLWASLVAGLSGDINLFLGFWLTLNLLLARAIMGLRAGDGATRRDCLAMAGICLAAALPAIVWALADTQNPAPQFSFKEFLYSYYPYHSFFHLQIGRFLAFLSLSIAACIAVSKELTNKNALATLMAASVVTVLAGAALPYVSDRQWVQNLYPLRYAALAHWLAALVIIQAWSRESQATRGAVFGAIAVLGFMLSTPVLTLLAIALMLDCRQRPRWQRQVLLACLAAGLISDAIPLVRTIPVLPLEAVETTRAAEYLGPHPVIAYVCGIGALLLTAYPSRALRWSCAILIWLVASTTLIGDRGILLTAAAIIMISSSVVLNGLDGKDCRFCIVAVGIAGALMALHLYSAGAARAGLGSLAISAVVLILSDASDALRGLEFYRRHRSASLLLGTCVLALSALGIAMGARQGFDPSANEYDRDFRAAQEWARRNTAPDTLFYEPEDRGFAILSRRPVWWSWKQGAAVMWEPSFYPTWRERQLKATSALTLSELAQLAYDEGIGFLVLPRERLTSSQPNGLIERYCNEHYCIFQIV